MLSDVTRLRRFLLVAAVGGTVLGLFLLLLIPGVARAFSSVSYKSSVPDLKSLSEPATLYASDGQTVIGRLGTEDRQPVSINQVPVQAVQAVIATEDKTFFTNGGIDIRAAVRALTTNVQVGGVDQGGSTITQQLIKKRLLSDKREVSRKAREAVLAMELTGQISKAAILEEYLNTVYFGQGSYGIGSAAKRFFKKPVEQLTLPEAALLAGVISNPEGANPFFYPEKATARRNFVLDRMVDEKYITQADADFSKLAPLPTERPPAELRPDNYFVEEVQRRLLNDPRLGATAQERYNAVLRGGLKVYTTLDLDAQQRAQDSVDSILPKQPPFTAALVSMDPNNGEVRAIVGGPNFSEQQFNLATQAKRQPGSTYKVITLATALSNGYGPNDTIDGTSPCTVKARGSAPWTTQNAEPGGGVITLRAAITGSVNCAFGHLIAAVGPENVADYARKMGITGNVPAYPSITLGTAEATPLEMATVFSTIASGGIRHDPVFIRKVVGPDKKTIFSASTEGERVLDENVASTEIDMLKGVVSGGTGTRAQISGREVFGKTGTTDEKSDAWFGGCTAQLCATVWMGAIVGRVPMRNVGGIAVFGGTYPARIWHDYMVPMLDGQPSIAFPRPNSSVWPSSRFISDGGRGKASVPASPGDVTTGPAPGPTATAAGSSTTAPSTTAPSTTAKPKPSSTTTTTAGP